MHLGFAFYIYQKLNSFYIPGVNGMHLIFLGFGIEIIYLLFVISFPQLMYKQQERTLSVNMQGIHTTIGSKKGDIPWTEIEDIDSKGSSIFLERKKTGNTFTIPDRAFKSVDDKTEFLTSTIGWHAQSTNY